MNFLKILPVIFALALGLFTADAPTPAHAQGVSVTVGPNGSAHLTRESRRQRRFFDRRRNGGPRQHGVRDSRRRVWGRHGRRRSDFDNRHRIRDSRRSSHSVRDSRGPRHGVRDSRRRHSRRETALDRRRHSRRETALDRRKHSRRETRLDRKDDVGEVCRPPSRKVRIRRHGRWTYICKRPEVDVCKRGEDRVRVRRHGRWTYICRPPQIECRPPSQKVRIRRNGRWTFVCKRPEIVECRPGERRVRVRRHGRWTIVCRPPEIVECRPDERRVRVRRNGRWTYICRPPEVVECEPDERRVRVRRNGRWIFVCRPPEVVECEPGERRVRIRREGRWMLVCRPPVVVECRRGERRVRVRRNGKWVLLCKRPDRVDTGPGGTPPDAGDGSSETRKVLLRAPDRNNPPAPILNGMPPDGETRFVPDEVLVRFVRQVNGAEIDAVAANLNLTELERIELASIDSTVYRFRLPTNLTVRQAIAALEAVGQVAIAQPNYLFALNEDRAKKVSAGRFVRQYAVDRMRLTQAHKLALGDKVLIAIIDSGIDTTHPELRGVVSESFDALDGKGEKVHSHGTAIAGVVASHARLTGVAPGARLLAVRAFGIDASGDSAFGTSAEIQKGFDWAYQQGAQVINMSFAGPEDPTLGQLFRDADENGVLMVAAAGNDGPDAEPAYPAADPYVIAVTATDSSDRLFKKANRGGYIFVAAPGVDIVAPAPNTAYQIQTGTSLAAAHVSGLIALMLQKDGSLTPDRIREHLRKAAEDLGKPGIDDDFGVGLPDAVIAITQR